MLSLLGSLTKHGWRHTIAALFSRHNSVIKIPAKTHSRKYARVRRKHLHSRKCTESTYQLVDKWEESDGKKGKRYKKIPGTSPVNNESEEEWTSTRKRFRDKRDQRSRPSQGGSVENGADKSEKTGNVKNGKKASQRKKGSKQEHLPLGRSMDDRSHPIRIVRETRGGSRKHNRTNNTLSPESSASSQLLWNGKRSPRYHQQSHEMVVHTSESGETISKSTMSRGSQQHSYSVSGALQDINGAAKSTIRRVHTDSNQATPAFNASEHDTFGSQALPEVQNAMTSDLQTAKIGNRPSQITPRRNIPHFFQQPAMSVLHSSEFVFNERLPTTQQYSTLSSSGNSRGIP